MTDEAWIDTVRLARELGTVEALLPEGISTMADLPYSVFDAIRTATVILSFDELPKDERPPKRIWLDGERLTEWFEEVERRREEKYGGASSNPGDAPIDDPVQNDAVRRLIVA